MIGAGSFVSRRHLPDVQSSANLTLSALCRRDDGARARMAEHFGVAPERAFADWRQMLDETPLDAVLIATPNSLHFEQAQAALERGLHVLLEKPMTIQSEDARELVRLAREKGLQSGRGAEPALLGALPPRPARARRARRWGRWRASRSTGRAPRSHLFGRTPPPANLPGVVPPTSYRADPELNGGGYFVDGGPHMVSELIWVTGQRIRRVTAFMDATPSDMRATLRSSSRTARSAPSTLSATAVIPSGAS